MSRSVVRNEGGQYRKFDHYFNQPVPAELRKQLVKARKVRDSVWSLHVLRGKDEGTLAIYNASLEQVAMIYREIEVIERALPQ